MKVAAYGTSKAIAEKLGLSEAADLLNETQAEEEEADKKLTEVAETLYEEVLSDHEVTEEDEEEVVVVSPRRTQAKRSVKRTR
jgi:rubrerythrin